MLKTKHRNDFKFILTLIKTNRSNYFWGLILWKTFHKNYKFGLLSSFSPDPVCWYAYQVTVGSGYPEALHQRLTVSPNMLDMKGPLCFGIDADSFFFNEIKTNQIIGHVKIGYPFK